jgi:hypothetical protein
MTSGNIEAFYNQVLDPEFKGRWLEMHEPLNALMPFILEPIVSV